MKGYLIIFLLFLGKFSFAQKSGAKGDFVSIRYQNGQVSSEGYMVNGKPDGYWKTYYVTGILKSEGNRKNHLLDSTWLFYNELGDTTERISYLNGKKNGYYLKYETALVKNTTRKNCIRSRELYVDDKKEGDAFYYYPDGLLYEIIHFKNNRRHGPGKEFDKNGVLITLYQFSNDYMTEKLPLNRKDTRGRQGIWRDYTENGKLKSEHVYKNDLLDGYSKVFDLNENVSLSLLYRNDKLIKQKLEDTLNFEERISYYEDGYVKEKGYFKNSIPIGIHRIYNHDGKIIDGFIYGESGKILSEGIIGEDGSKEGTWKNFYENGEVQSTGDYLNNRQNGPWKFFLRGGFPEQTGSFASGYISGEWKWYFYGGNLLRIENYNKGRRDGKYIEFSNWGDTLVNGSYQGGEMNGFWITRIGDIVEKGKYRNGLKDSIWCAYYGNGCLYYKGNYIQGNPDGKHLYFYDDAKIMEIQEYVNGIKEHTWKRFLPDGLLLIAVTYEHDMETRINGIRIERRK